MKAERFGKQENYYIVVAEMAAKNVRPLGFSTEIIAHGFCNRENLYGVQMILGFSATEGGCYHTTKGNWYTTTRYHADVKAAIKNSVQVSGESFSIELCDWENMGRTPVKFSLGLLKSARMDYNGKVIQPYIFKRLSELQGKSKIDRFISMLDLKTDIRDGDVLLPPKISMHLKINC